MQCTSGSECPSGTAEFDAGPSATTDWMIQDNPVLESATDSASVTGSEFHINWTSASADSATGVITGDTSAIVLSDGTSIAFPNGTPFVATTSAFFFAPAIAFQGQLPPTFAMATNTLASGSFTAPTVSAAVVSVPVPAIPGAWAATLAIALAAAAWGRSCGDDARSTVFDAPRAGLGSPVPPMVTWSLLHPRHALGRLGEQETLAVLRASPLSAAT
jgi:hypothetical protein